MRCKDNDDAAEIVKGVSHRGQAVVVALAGEIFGSA